ncbi:formylglycine-generating enzyme family protein [Ancylobacter sp. IITR112]|uniref:formylglycine-generating enzyme family protein n=1 Tax=Ancylobacter sp. IITR112 TaxID=3138073 RepID=UPI00352A41FF
MTVGRRSQGEPGQARRAAPLVAVLAGLHLLAQGRAAAAADAWNPSPMADDVVLALPCSQKIAFRRVVTDDAARQGAVAILDDRRIRIGSSNRERAYVDYLRADFISGNFQKGDRRFFLIAKYEVTAAQYKSLTTSGCNLAAADADMPVTRISWYDAANFNRLLTSHLLRTGKSVMQREIGGTKFFARLPTETEWEYAARGGLSVSIADFQAERFPMQGELIDYAWVNHPQSAEDLNPIGQLKPNPLGLFDVYGNAAEMMFEPFRMNKAGRPHGLSGGLILKGGSFQSSPSFVTSAAREEDAFFIEETGEEKRPRTTGFRPVLVGPALPTSTDVTALVDEWNRSSESRLPAIQDPLALVERARDGLSDLQLANGLNSIEQAIRNGIAETTEEKKALLSGLMIDLGRTIYEIRKTRTSINNRAVLLRPENASRLGEAQVSMLKRYSSDEEGEIRDMNHFAHDTIVRIGNGFPPGEIDEQAQSVAAELRQRALSGIADGVIIGASIARRQAAGGQALTRQDVLNLAVSGL